MANQKVPLTHQQKIARGYEQVGTVGVVAVYLTPSDIRQIKMGVAVRDKLIAYKLEQEKKRQDGGELANGPIAPELTQRANCLIKATGTRNWATFSKSQLEKMFSKEGVAVMRGFIKTMPNTPSPSAVAASSVGGDGEDDE